MGNTQGGQAGNTSRRDRSGTNDASHFMRPRGYSSIDADECPVQVKIAKQAYNTQSSTPSMQFQDECELPVVIKWHGPPAKKVTIAGSWDNWKKPLPLVKSHEDFSTIINIPEGRHEFKFKVDDQWMCDPTLPKTDTDTGTQNNVMVVDKADFHVFDALDRDAAQMSAETAEKVVATHTPAPTTGDTATSDAAIKVRDKLFTQDVPDRNEFERAHNPPALPPHLLQVILNKDTPVQCDPNVLPEPNHVMLNHLYALSIKDGVMVLSATHRYKKKYVTTLLYKPIS